MRRRTTALLGCIAMLVLVAVACGGGKQTPGGQQTTPPATSSPTGPVVKGTDQLTFDPATLTVKVGETVTWINSGTAAHTVTFTVGAAFDKPLNQGDTVTRTFDAAGTFSYFCTTHGQAMSGKIVVA